MINRLCTQCVDKPIQTYNSKVTPKTNELNSELTNWNNCRIRTTTKHYILKT